MPGRLPEHGRDGFTVQSVPPTKGCLPPSPMISDVGRDRQFARAPVHDIRLEVPGRACGRERPGPALRGLWSAHASPIVATVADTTHSRQEAIRRGADAPG